MKPISIINIKLLDIRLPHSPDVNKSFLIDAKQLLEKAPAKKGVYPELFHNDQNRYSDIQIARYQGAVSFTAIGKDAVKTLKYWYKLFKSEHKKNLHNTLICTERYTPAFLSYQKKYRIRTLLISDNIAKELNQIPDKFARMERLEKYLTGNVKRFLKHINYDTEDNFIKLNVSHFSFHPKALEVYHGQKKTAVDISFQINFALPQHLRLGQSTAIGYGKLTHL